MNSENKASEKTILILSGPNLNLLGERDPQMYGDQTLDQHIELAERTASQHGITVEHLQSNHEGEIIDTLQTIDKKIKGIVINPAAFTHTSVALRDAISGVSVPVIEDQQFEIGLAQLRKNRFLLF